MPTIAEPRLDSAQAAGSLRLPRHGDAEPHRNPFLQLLRAYLDAYLPRPGASPAACGMDMQDCADPCWSAPTNLHGKRCTLGSGTALRGRCSEQHGRWLLTELVRHHTQSLVV